MNRFEKLASIDCSAHIEQKNKLNYLSWAWAWDTFKRMFPDSYYTVYESGGKNYFDDGKTAWVKTGVTLVDDDYELELIEFLPVMDFRNSSIPVEKLTSFDVNKTIQRSLTKAIARHGLGLYIYAGEDLPEDAERPAPAPVEPMRCKDCGAEIKDALINGKLYTAAQIAASSEKKYGKRLCYTCVMLRKED